MEVGEGGRNDYWQSGSATCVALPVVCSKCSAVAANAGARCAEQTVELKM